MAHIAVVIPAYQVARHIEHVVRRLPGFVRHVIVVDDGSTDETRHKLMPLLGERVRLACHRKNQGVGGAMLTGYALALELGATVVVKVDGDDQMDPAQLERLVVPIINGEADYTKGTRFIHTHDLTQMPVVRRLGNLGLTFLTKAASGYWNMFDPTNGYTAIHATLLRLINTKVIARDYFFETSMLLEMRRLGAVVVDVPMPARYGQEESSLSAGRALFSFPPRLLGGFWRRVGQQYFLHDFNAASVLMLLGLPLFLFGWTWGAVHWYVSATQQQLASTGTVLIAVLPIIVGIQFLTQALALDIASVPTAAVCTRAARDGSCRTHPFALTSQLERTADLVERIES